MGRKKRKRKRKRRVLMAAGVAALTYLVVRKGEKERESAGEMGVEVPVAVLAGLGAEGVVWGNEDRDG
jgi:hypothetical protein